jgi:hypothetical protein
MDISRWDYRSLRSLLQVVPRLVSALAKPSANTQRRPFRCPVHLAHADSH